jgi:hypothetical protein
MGIHWTCCQCEQQVEDHQYDSDERMCEDCLNAPVYCKLTCTEDLPDKMVDDEFWRREVYLYLEQLRESGETNMFGAGVYLEKHFKLPKYEARKYLSDWMNQYNKGE